MCSQEESGTGCKKKSRETPITKNLGFIYRGLEHFWIVGSSKTYFGWNVLAREKWVSGVGQKPARGRKFSSSVIFAKGILSLQ